MSSQMVNSPRQELGAKRAETVERLFEAGDDELRAVGHDALTIRTVAARAGVSAATAYTYLASKNHLFAELFLRELADRPGTVIGEDPVARVRSVTRGMAELLAAHPALSAAVTPALLSSDPDVARLRLRIGTEMIFRFASALTDEATGTQPDPVLLEALALAFSGALLQAGMGLMTYTEMADRLDLVVAAICLGHSMKGHPS